MKFIYKNNIYKYIEEQDKLLIGAIGASGSITWFRCNPDMLDNVVYFGTLWRD